MRVSMNGRGFLSICGLKMREKAFVHGFNPSEVLNVTTKFWRIKIRKFIEIDVHQIFFTICILTVAATYKKL